MNRWLTMLKKLDLSIPPIRVDLALVARESA
jgi:hypothetical protein